MVITLYTEEIMSDLRGISHHEVAEIPDVEARYRAEAGTEKQHLIYKCVSEGVTRLARRCVRFLKGDYKTEADNAGDIPKSYSLEFAFSERRALNKADALAETMHFFVLHYALSDFYSDVSQGELSNKHSLMAVEAGNGLDALLYHKQPPVL